MSISIHIPEVLIDNSISYYLETSNRPCPIAKFTVCKKKKKKKKKDLDTVIAS